MDATLPPLHRIQVSHRDLDFREVRASRRHHMHLSQLCIADATASYADFCVPMGFGYFLTCMGRQITMPAWKDHLWHKGVCCAAFSSLYPLILATIHGACRGETMIVLFGFAANLTDWRLQMIDVQSGNRRHGSDTGNLPVPYSMLSGPFAASHLLSWCHSSPSTQLENDTTA
jgi:hypothetical protein